MLPPNPSLGARLAKVLTIAASITSMCAASAAFDRVKADGKTQLLSDQHGQALSGAPTSSRSGSGLKIATAKGLLLSAAEKISLRCLEFPLLSGDYRISDDNSVSLPMVGRVDILNASPSDLERELSEELQRRTGRESHVTIEIIDYKPVFVTGYVNRTGAYPWKPDYTVMHAEALAGGVYRPAETNSALPADTEKARTARAASDLARVLVQHARMQVEKAGGERVLLDAELLGLVPKPEAVKLVEAQNNVLMSRRASHEAQLQGLKRSEELALEEVGGLKQQLLRLDDQLKLRSDYNVKVGGLVKRGIVRYERSLDEQTRVADIEEKRTNIVVALSRIHGALATLTRELVVIQETRAATLDADLIRAEREVAQLKLEVQASRAAFRKLTGRNVSSGMSDINVTQPAIVYEIVRNKNSVPSTIKADWLTALQPGDLLVVRMEEISAH